MNLITLLFVFLSIASQSLSQYTVPAASSQLLNGADPNDDSSDPTANNGTAGAPDPELAQFEDFDEGSVAFNDDIRQLYNFYEPLDDNGPHYLASVQNISGLTSRDTTGPGSENQPFRYEYTASNGVQSGCPIVPISLNFEARGPFLLQAQQFGSAAAQQNAPPNQTDPAGYFKYTSGDLSLIVVVPVSGQHGYGWTNFAFLASELARVCNSGGIYDTGKASISITGRDDNGTTQIYGALISSYGDLPGPNLSAGSQSSTGGGGRRRSLRVRQSQSTYTRSFGPGNQFRLRLTSAATKVAYGLLAELINNAYDELMMDSRSTLIYSHESRTQFVSDQAVGNIIQMDSTAGIHPDVYKAALTSLARFANKYEWIIKAGKRPAFTGEILDRSGKVLATIGLGLKAITGLFCVVENPDGTKMIGCIRRDEL